ncbi:MAG TPA: LysM domain-containing protein, partial [Bacteroidales bacterium]|nr:LysM domain-containing protein [Bacteroidales bacterium]
MRNSIIISIWFICISFFSNTIYSQNQLIAKSQVIENIDAKKYYIHTVQAKETAYAISRAYGISYSELLQHNPGIETGLSIGQTLKIPYTEQ